MEVVRLTLLAVGLVAMIYGFRQLLYVDPKLRARGNLIMAAGYAMHAASLMMFANSWVRSFGCADAALAAWCFHDWWNGGGGDGLKKRLKSWAQSVGRGVAPQGV